jgi:uncharacterized protein (TIGR03435 family)
MAMTRSRLAGSAILAVTAAFFAWKMGAQQMQQLKPMAPDAHPAFEVATIKHSDPDDGSRGFHTSGRNIFIENETMDDLISFAYGVHAKQIVDAPAWFGSERLDIKGFADVEGTPSVTQYREMVKKLLTDRLQLQFQSEKREMSCFALTVAKGGPKIEATKSAPDAGQDQTGDNNGGRASWRFTNNSMPEFAQFLQMAVLDRPVVDQTGLKGKYDFKLTWTKDIAPATDENAAPGFLTAIQEQAGLKVEPSRAEVDVLAITHAEQPSEN